MLLPKLKRCRCWPAALKGRDLLSVAPPGSGKTLAYLLPCIPLLQQAAQLRSAAQQQQQQPLALLLAPTRELAMQIGHACKPLRSLFGLHSTVITGGTDKQQQVHNTSAQHFLTASPDCKPKRNTHLNSDHV